MEIFFRNAYPSKVKLVIFDWAGTTIDYGCIAPVMAFIKIFQDKSIPITIPQARQPMGLGKRDHIAGIGQLPEVAEMWKKLYNRSMSEQDVDDMYLKFVPVQMKCIKEYSDLIPGTIETVTVLRKQGILIGSTTGYFKEALTLVLSESAKQGFTPDSNVCISDVPAGRPQPWMIFQNMISTGVYPPCVVVKVDDTKPGIEEGLNAGVWTIGVAKTGNALGLNEDEISTLSTNELQQRLEIAYTELSKAGAHFVVDSVAEVPAVIDKINSLLTSHEYSFYG